MKYKELKERYKNRFSIRMIAGVLCVALIGGSFGIYQLQEGKMMAVQAVVEEDERSAKADDTDTHKKESSKKDTEKTLADRLVSVLDQDTQQNLDAKEETVYLITDANGNVKQTIVSNWLKNGSANAEIKDVSELSEIG